MSRPSKIEDALKAARLYYYQNMTTTAIAKELNVSSSTVSRLIRYARESGFGTNPALWTPPMNPIA